MIVFKACYRCAGDLFLDKDLYGAYFQCLQCGCIKDLDLPVETPRPALRATERAAGARSALGL